MRHKKIRIRNKKQERQGNWPRGIVPLLRPTFKHLNTSCPLLGALKGGSFMDFKVISLLIEETPKFVKLLENIEKKSL
ncbi:MAG: hypothetical protein ACP5UF_06420 [Hydrogenobaculum sp.]